MVYSVGLTSEKQLLSSTQESLLSLRVGNRVEAANAHDFANRITTAVIGIRVRAQNAAEIRLKPELVSGFPLLPALIDTIALDRARNGNMNSHV